MSVWYCIPSARPPEEAEPVLKQWKERGYKIALLVDWNPPGVPLYSRRACGDLMLCGGGKFKPQFNPATKELYGPEDNRIYFPHFNEYPGYAQSVNALILEVMKVDPQADWFVTGGDDVLPDPNKSAEEIARECSEHFVERVSSFDAHGEEYMDYDPGTFGVMQPTGHRYGEDPTNPNPAMRSAYIDRVAGSAWMGREWCRRMNKGQGPFHPGFTHMFSDECLQECAVKLGVFWQRRDLTHEHRHWGLPRPGEKHGDADRMPEHLKKWNTPEHWRESKALFDRLKAEGFEECMPIP